MWMKQIKCVMLNCTWGRQWCYFALGASKPSNNTTKCFTSSTHNIATLINMWKWLLATSYMQVHLCNFLIRHNLKESKINAELYIWNSSYIQSVSEWIVKKVKIVCLVPIIKNFDIFFSRCLDQNILIAGKIISDSYFLTLIDV